MYNKSKRVVVTGLGTVTPYGVGAQILWDNVKNGKSCITNQPTLYNTEINPTKICGEFLGFDATEYLDP